MGILTLSNNSASGRDLIFGYRIICTMETEWSIPVPTESEPEIVDLDGFERCPCVFGHVRPRCPGGAGTGC